MRKALKIKKAIQPVIPVMEYELQAALITEGYKPVNVFRDKKGNIWLTFKNTYDVRTTIERYHLGILRVSTDYVFAIDNLSLPPYWFE